MTGGFRPARHGHLVTRPPLAVPSKWAAFLPAPAAERVPAWQPSADDLAGLVDAAKAFITRTAADDTLSDTYGLLTVAAGHALDRMLRFQSIIDADGVLQDGKPHPLTRPLAAEQRAFVSLLRQLGLKPLVPVLLPARSAFDEFCGNIATTSSAPA